MTSKTDGPIASTEPRASLLSVEELTELVEFLRDTAYDNPAPIAAKLIEAADTITTLKGEIERRDEIYRDRLRSMRPSSARSDDFLAGYKAAVDEALLAIGAEVIIP